MAFASAPRLQRFLAISLLVFAAWGMLRLVMAYAIERSRLAGEVAETRNDFFQLRERRVDIALLEQQLSLLNTSEVVRQSTIEAPTDRAALIKLQQIARAAVEETQGKINSSIESTTGQLPNTVGLLIRVRVREEKISQLLSNLENGTPRIGIDELALVSRPTKLGEADDVEMTMTLRGRWLAAGKAAR